MEKQKNEEMIATAENFSPPLFTFHFFFVFLQANEDIY